MENNSVPQNNRGSFYRVTKSSVTPTMTVEDIVEKISKATGKNIGVGLRDEGLVPVHGNVFPFSGLVRKKLFGLF
jgi:hypothetical protein